MQDKIFKRAFILLIVIGVLHQIAMLYSLYWTLSWFDILLHFLGGAWVALIFIWFQRMGKMSTSRLFNTPLRAAIVGTLLIGALWEIFEYITGQTFAIEGYTLDTIMDFIMDTTGALVAYYYSKKLHD